MGHFFTDPQGLQCQEEAGIQLFNLLLQPDIALVTLARACELATCQHFILRSPKLLKNCFVHHFGNAPTNPQEKAFEWTRYCDKFQKVNSHSKQTTPPATRIPPDAQVLALNSSQGAATQLNASEKDTPHTLVPLAQDNSSIALSEVLESLEFEGTGLPKEAEGESNRTRPEFKAIAENENTLSHAMSTPLTKATAIDKLKQTHEASNSCFLYAKTVSWVLPVVLSIKYI